MAQSHKIMQKQTGKFLENAMSLVLTKITRYNSLNICYLKH